MIDILIIGLGPGGGSAAISAARAGAQVLAVERRTVLGEPVQCAELVPLALSFQVQGVISQTVAGMRTVLPSGAESRIPFPGLIIDRAAFDQRLAQQAANLGAQIQIATRLIGLDPQQQRAQLIGPNGFQEIHYGLLIAADGPHSTVATALGLPPLPIVHTRQYQVPLLRPYNDTDIWLSESFPGGYGWLFPKGDTARLGIGIDKRYQTDLKVPLDTLHATLVHQGRVGRTVLSRTGGVIPVGGLRRSLVEGQIIFVGDAGGFTHPITGAGIAAAVVSGEQAGKTAAAWLGGEKQALVDYECDMVDHFQSTLERAVSRRAYLNRVWNTPHARLDRIHRYSWIAFDDYFAADEPDGLRANVSGTRNTAT